MMRRSMKTQFPTRRSFLESLAATTLVAPSMARALGGTSLFTWAQIVYDGRWNPRPTGSSRLLWEVTKRTSIECALRPAAVPLSAPELFRYPFLCLAGHEALPPFPDDELRSLRRHLGRGRMLFVEDADPREGSAFDRSVRALLARVLPGEPLRAAPSDHVIYKSFYLLSQPQGRVLHKPFVEVIERDLRCLVLYSQNDAQGAWARDGAGKWELDVIPGGAQQREMAFRFGVNLVMYALCGSYKRDQVHAPFILS
jgi:hypothetical protein